MPSNRPERRPVVSEDLNPSEETKEVVDIEALERDKARLSQTIDKTSKELGEMIGRLGAEANQVANKVSDEASAVMNYHRSASRKVMETVNSEEASVRETVSSLASSLDYFFWVVASLLVGFGLVTGYIVSGKEFDLTINLQYFVFPASPIASLTKSSMKFTST